MGVFGGFAAGLLGIGGGMILMPFMTMMFEALQVSPQLIAHMAIATCLATILFTPFLPSARITCNGRSNLRLLSHGALWSDRGSASR